MGKLSQVTLTIGGVVLNNAAVQIIRVADIEAAWGIMENVNVEHRHTSKSPRGSGSFFEMAAQAGIEPATK